MIMNFFPRGWLASISVTGTLERATENKLDDAVFNLYEEKLPPFNSENILANIFIGSWKSIMSFYVSWS